MLVPSLLVVVGLSLVAYFMKHLFEGLEASVKELMSKLGSHDARIAVSEQRLGSVELEQERQRRNHHELRNDLQGYLLKRRAGE